MGGLIQMLDFIFHFLYYSRHDVNKQKSPKNAVQVKPFGFALSALKAVFVFRNERGACE
jgi:hypothetical protein